MTMASWQIQQMKEDMDAQKWEEMNAPNPMRKQLLSAADSLNSCIIGMEEACSNVAGAAMLLEDIPEGDKLTSILVDLEDLKYNLKRMQEAFSRGCTE